MKQNPTKFSFLSREEYTYSAVPDHKRKHFIQVAAVWMGFTMAASLAVLGGIVQKGVGVSDSIIAIIIGNGMLFVYATLLGVISFRSGLNFPLVAKRAFGNKGYIFASFILSFLVLGWFAVQADMFGVLLNSTIFKDIPRWQITLPFSFLFMLTALLGYRAMVLLSYLVIPSFLILGSMAAFQAFSREGLSFNLTPEEATMGMGQAISIVAASFIVSATMTGDIVRWARSVKDIIIIHFLAFIVGLGSTMLFGVFLSAAGESTDIFSTLVILGLAVPGAIMTGLNLWSTCDNCLYNSSIGFSNQLKTIFGRETSDKIVIVTLGIIGAVIATFGAYGHYESWLLLLGTVVPPAGGIIISDYYFAFRHQQSVRYKEGYVVPYNYQPWAFVAWVGGVFVAYWTEQLLPFIPAAYVGLIVGGLIYYLGSKNKPLKTPASTNTN